MSESGTPETSKVRCGAERKEEEPCAATKIPKNNYATLALAIVISTMMGFVFGAISFGVKQTRDSVVLERTFTTEELSRIGFDGSSGEPIEPEDLARIQELVGSQFGTRLSVTGGVTGPLNTFVVVVFDRSKDRNYIYTVLPTLDHIVPAPPIDMVSRPLNAEYFAEIMGLQRSWYIPNGESSSNKASGDSRVERLRAFAEPRASTSIQQSSPASSAAASSPAHTSGVALPLNEENPFTENDLIIEDFRRQVMEHIRTTLAEQEEHIDEIPNTDRQPAQSTLPSSRQNSLPSLSIGAPFEESSTSAGASTNDGAAVLRSFIGVPATGGQSAVSRQSESNADVNPSSELSNPTPTSSSRRDEGEARSSAQESLVRRMISRSYAFPQGSADAPVEIFAIVDPTCPYSYQMHEWVDPHVEAGTLRVNWIPVSNPENIYSILMSTNAAYLDITSNGNEIVYESYRNMVRTFHEYSMNYFRDAASSTEGLPDELEDAAKALRIYAISLSSGIREQDHSLSQATSRIIERNIGNFIRIRDEGGYPTAGTPFIVQLTESGKLNVQNGASQEVIDFIASEWR